ERLSLCRRGSEMSFPPMQTPATDPIPTFERVLIATDFSAASKAAFRTALDTCVRFHASLLVLHVFEYGEMPPPETGGLLLEMQGLRENCQHGLEGLCQEASCAGVTCETVLQDGNASDCILETLAAKQVDLAVLGTNALRGVELVVFGSTAETVLRKSS